MKKVVLVLVFVLAVGALTAQLRPTYDSQPVPQKIPSPTTPEPRDYELIEKDKAKIIRDSQPNDWVDVVAFGPETKGKRVRLPGLGVDNEIQLPADVWVSFIGSSFCETDCPGVFVGLMREGIDETLWIGEGRVKPDERYPADMMVKFRDVIEILETKEVAK